MPDFYLRPAPARRLPASIISTDPRAKNVERRFRLSPLDAARLDAAAALLGVDRAVIVRTALLEFLDHLET